LPPQRNSASLGVVKEQRPPLDGPERGGATRVQGDAGMRDKMVPIEIQRRRPRHGGACVEVRRQE